MRSNGSAPKDGNGLAKASCKVPRNFGALLNSKQGLVPQPPFRRVVPGVYSKPGTVPRAVRAGDCRQIPACELVVLIEDKIAGQRRAVVECRILDGIPHIRQTAGTGCAERSDRQGSGCEDLR